MHQTDPKWETLNPKLSSSVLYVRLQNYAKLNWHLESPSFNLASICCWIALFQCTVSCWGCIWCWVTWWCVTLVTVSINLPITPPAAIPWRTCITCRLTILCQNTSGTKPKGKLKGFRDSVYKVRINRNMKIQLVRIKDKEGNPQVFDFHIYLFGGDVMGQGHGLQSDGFPIVAFP